MEAGGRRYGQAPSREAIFLRSRLVLIVWQGEPCKREGGPTPQRDSTWVLRGRIRGGLSWASSSAQNLSGEGIVRIPSQDASSPAVGFSLMPAAPEGFR